LAIRAAREQLREDEIPAVKEPLKLSDEEDKAMNPKKSTKPTIPHALITKVLFIAIGSIGLIGIIWIWTEFSGLRDELTSMRETLLTAHKTLIKNEVDSVASYINYKKRQVDKQLKGLIQERVHEAHAIASNIFEQYKGIKQPSEIKETIREALRPIRFNNGRGYYFAFNLEGIEELFPDQPEMEGKNLSDLQDADGQYVIRDMIRLAQTRGEDFYTYTWTRPHADGNFSKIAFVKFFKPLNWVIGAGDYTSHVEQDIQAAAIEYIEQISFRSDSYIFATRWDGVSLTNPGKGRNNIHITDANGVKIVQELIRISKTGSGYLEYVMPKMDGKRPDPKLAYVVGIPEWNWYVGTGIYIDEIESAIEQKKAEVEKQILQHIFKIILILVIFVFFISFFAIQVAKKSKANIDLLTDFFAKAATESASINPDLIDFAELETLARSANEMAKARHKAEGELRKSEERLNLALDSVNDAVWDWNVGTGKVYFSPRWYTMLGYEPYELPQEFETWRTLLHPDDLAESEPTILKHLESGETFQIEFRMKAKDGRWQWVLARGKAVERDDQGNASRMIGTHVDITERINYQYEQEITIGLLRALHNETDLNGLLREVTGLMQTWSGCEAVGIRLQKEGELIRDRCHGEGYESVALIPLTLGNQRIGLIQFNDTQKGRFDENKIILLERLASSLAVGISQRKTALALKESEEKYRSMMESMTDLAYICSHDFIIEYMNPSMIKRVGRNAVGETCYKGIHGFDKKCPWCMYEKIRKGESIVKEILSPLDNKTYLISSSPILHTDGSISKLTVFRNITEIKKMEKTVQQSQKMESIGTLAGGIAHDFNNILFPIIGHTEMLLDDIPEENSSIRNSLNEIYTAALRARDLVQQILAFSRQESSELKLIKMQPIINEALKLIRAAIPTTISITRNIQPDCGAVKADPTQIHQIVMNLTTNAYHAMEKNGGELKVALKAIEVGDDDLVSHDLTPGSYACLIVSDTGIGMNKDVMNRIFDPFFTAKEKGKGTGMGLSVVHGIVKTMKGAIQVSSEPDRGTEFHVYLPIVQSSFDTQEVMVKEPLLGGAEKVLLVDDEDSIITMEEQVLARLGYQVTTCADSTEALEIFRSGPDQFDLVITDMSMPKMSGDKLAVELIKIRGDIPILICTGFSESMTDEKIKSLGIRGLLMKPMVIKDLAKKIREILD
jgi:PAS domain S-box-containing protein